MGRRMKITFSYDGSGFYGYQIQPNLRTVQGAIEYTIRKVDYEPISIVASGRTDTGVHALAQVAHFDVARDTVYSHNFQHIFNQQLPLDIIVDQVEEVDENFHARFDVVSKEYWYKFRTLSEQKCSPFTSRYYTYIRDKIELNQLNQICQEYLGTHDFTSFTTMPAGYDCVRTIHHCYCEYDPLEACYIFKIKGTGFTQYMVRILVAYMFEIYQGREKIETIKSLYASRDRLYVHCKMEPAGLYLHHVSYE